ncbi:MAG: SDR family oxidoreductase [Acidobacteria bacterium]|nr:SDR family oxidoreductase [Acidobacteriota bacterium]MBI3427112.1 SDR family oxidoreductase [Acidobacteriota bacterium]
MAALTGKIALITGASSGIGKGIAEAFAAAGAQLVLTARRAELLTQLAETLPTEVLALPADVTDETQVQAVFQQTVQRFGRLDILVNNAGVFDGGPLDELSLATWEKVMAVNLRGPFLCTREALRLMKPQGSGRIINIGSISAQRVRPNSAPYSTSKFGLAGLTQVTALEGRSFGITCGCIHPGNTAVETLADAQRRAHEPVMQIAEWAQVAVTMAALPAHVNLLEAIVLPREQPYLGRG